MDSEELMIENPVGVAILLGLLPRNSSCHLPISNESLQQFILEDVMLTINLQFGVISRHLPCDTVCGLRLYSLSRSNLGRLTLLSSRVSFGSSEGILHMQLACQLLPMRISLFGLICSSRTL